MKDKKSINVSIIFSMKKNMRGSDRKIRETNRGEKERRGKGREKGREKRKGKRKGKEAEESKDVRDKKKSRKQIGCATADVTP